MQIEKKINERLLIVNWSIWSGKLGIEYDSETIHESWEILFWVTIFELSALLIGIFIGILFFKKIN